jgi:outer membrane protein TolC
VSELTQARADAGVLTELEAVNARVLESQQEEQIASLSARRFAAAVRLVKALGGGWDDTSVK